MLKIYDKNHNAIGHVVKYRDCKIESEVATGDKTLSFVYLAKHHNLQNEMYVQTKDDEYVIKEVPATAGAFPQIVAVLNLEDLQKDMWQTFSVTDVTIDEAVRTVLAGTGWTIGECDVTKRRNAGMMQVSTLEVIQNLCTAFMCEPVFDTIGKRVSFYSQRGEDKGVYFISGLNLKKLQKKSTSYDYYTRIIPVGQNNLSIADVNDGKDYLENYQYSSKVLTYIWKDESYTDPHALMEDAQLKLNDLSKPEISYSADVRDLAKQKPEYGVLSYRLGDTVTIIDQETGTREKQRIKKMVEYPQDPEKNTCEIANTVLTFEEMQQKYQAAINIINNTVAGDGRYTGTINVSDILNFEKGLAGSSTIGGIQGNIADMEGDLAGIKLTIGQIDANFLRAEEADLKYATIENLNVVREDVHDLNADYATFKSATANELSAHTARIDTVIGDLASYKTTVTDELIAAKGWMAEGAIGDAQISSMDANKLTAGTIDTALVTIAGSDGKLQIADNTMKISDANRVRVQVGKDASGDYTLAVWDKAGNLIWDALGATDKTIQRKIIRDNVIAEDAAIQALKIDFQSFDTVLSDQGVTISGTVVQVGSKTLNVALSEQTQINTNYSEQLASHSSKITANEKAIALKVSSQTYEKDKTTMESALQTVESSVSVMDGQITALVQDVTVLQGDYNGLDSRTAKLELDSDNFSVELSSTKKTVSDNYTSLKQYTDTAKSSAISTAAADATSKANKALADAKTDATTKADAAQTAAIASAAADATSKADAVLKTAQSQIDSTNAVVATHTTTLSEHDTRITANENAISLKVWSKDVEEAVSAIDGKFASYSTTAEMQSAIEVAKSEINLSVSETYTTKQEFGALEIGGRNLYLKTKEYDASAYDGWVDGNNGKRAQTTAPYTYINGFGVQRITKAWIDISQSVPIEPRTYYTLSAWIKWEDAIGRIDFFDNVANTVPNVAKDVGNDSYVRVSITYNSGNATISTCRFECRSDTPYLIYGLKLEKGTKATDWTPAPEDIDSKITSLETWKTEASQKITKDGIIATVGNYYAYQSDLDTAESRITQAETTIAQHTGEIALTVKEQDVTGNYIVGKLNLSSTTAKIAAKNIDLSGYVTVSSLKTAGATTIDGSNITTGTISADRIDAESLMAKKLTATNLTVTGNSVFSGTLSGATGDFTGKITATSGKIGKWNIDGSINATNANGNYIYLGAGIGVNQDVLVVRTGTDSSSYKWPIILRATGEAIFKNATVTGNITANSLAAKCTIYLQNPSNTSAGSSAISYDGAKLILNGDYGGNQIGNGTINYGPLWVYGSGIELYFSTPYIDFHYGNSTSDYTSRIIEESSGVLAFTGAIRPYGGVITEAGIYRKPVGSSNANGNKCAVLKTNVNNSGTYYFTLSGQWGTAGADFTNKTFTATTSDIRLKDNIVDSKINALSVIDQIRIREFDWKEGGTHQKIGFVADELELLDSGLSIGGGWDEDGNIDAKGVNEFYLVGYLTKGIQELHTAQLSQANELLTLTARQDDQQVMIDYLLDENAALKKRVKELEKQIA